MSTGTRYLCVYCGAPRSATDEQCGSCRRGWIDERVIAAEDHAVAAEESGEPEVEVPYPTIDHKTPPAPPAPVEQRRAVPRMVWGAAAAAVLLLVIFVVGTGGDGGDDQATPTTTVQSTTTEVSTTAPPATSEPPATTTTDAPPTTTTTTSTTTTTAAPTIKTIGDPIPLETLTLGAFAIGQFEFGTPAEEAVGRLAATFGQPDALVAADEAWGLCPGESGSVLVWGPLSVITRTIDSVETLAAYRLDGGDPDHPASELATLSGLRLGSTTAELEAIYQAPIIEYTDIAGETAFRLLRSSDGRLLLWGPVSDDTVAGIYSPRPCDQGP